ncbi:hypothetical protein AMC83_PE00286 (plasmid) [Rhizobium phaseoli]|nr:hypothetical protein AMC83_PE00286 [Rhizobium phaseoli]
MCSESSILLPFLGLPKKSADLFRKETPDRWKYITVNLRLHLLETNAGHHTSVAGGDVRLVLDDDDESFEGGAGNVTSEA